MQPAVARLIMIQLDHRVRSRSCLVQLRPPLAPSPRPGIAEPHRRQQAKIGGFRPAVRDRDLDQDVFGIGLGVFDEHIEVAIVVEYSGVEQFELRLVLPASPVFFHQLPVGKFRLGILVEILHVRVRGRGVEVEVILLHVLAVIALVAGQAENPLFQDGIALVPQRQGETDVLLPVADASQAVFVPAVGARTGVIMGQVFPGVAIRAVVFAHRAPGTFAEIGPPAFPVLPARRRILTVGSLPAS